MTFLILFLGAFGIAWPIAVRIAEALIPGRLHGRDQAERPPRLTGRVRQAHAPRAELRRAPMALRMATERADTAARRDAMILRQ